MAVCIFYHICITTLKHFQLKSLLFQWHVDPLVLVFVFALLMIYFFLARTGKSKSVFYWTGILLFIVATTSPLHFLAMEYYFSAHMIAHVLILLVCGPLMAAGLPKSTGSVKASPMSAISKLFYNYPWIPWFSGVIIMWIWHIPVIYNRIHGDMNLSFSIFPALQSGSLLIAGILFSWPIFGPVQKFHIHPLSGVVYLFTACISCSLLGLLITFAHANTYTSAMTGMHGLLKGENPWQLTREADQQAAGLIMWVPCCLVYLSGCFILIARWFKEKKMTTHLVSDYTIH